MTGINSEINAGYFLQKALNKSDNALRSQHESATNDNFIERYKYSLVHSKSKSQNSNREAVNKGNICGLNLRQSIRSGGDHSVIRSTHNSDGSLQSVKEIDGEELNGSRSKEPKNDCGFIVCQNCGSYSQDFNSCDRCGKLLQPNSKMYLRDKNSESRIVSRSLTTEAFYRKKIPEQVYQRNYSRKRAQPTAAEPVCLTISSDEEDQNVVESGSPEIKSAISSSYFDNGIIAKRILLNEKRMSKFTTITLKCRSIRIGSFRYVPELPVVLTDSEILIHASLISGKLKVSIRLQLEDIVKLQYFIGKDMPVFFIETTLEYASEIRTKLNMRENNLIYYDPTADSEPQKRITILPDCISDDEKMKLLKLFRTYKEYMNVDDISHAEANKILVLSTPQHSSVFEARPNYIRDGKYPQTNQNKELAREHLKMMTYPPPPQTGGITITSEDFSCLEAGQFLNDAIIDFYLKYLVQNKLNEADRQRTHVFSSFFWRRLTQRTLYKPLSSEEPRLSPAEQRHSRVKTWTRHVDIFKKDFIIIPINERLHWFVAIICFSSLAESQPMSEYKSNALYNAISNENNAESPRQNVQMEEEKETRDLITSIDEEFMLEEDEETSSSTTLPLNDNSHLEEATTTTTTTNTTNKVKSPIVQPCILFFDSLMTGSHGRIASTLREYLRVEWQVKNGTVRKFDKEKMLGADPETPIQDNNSDCGIYLLQYVESFFEDPIKDFSIPVRGLKDWFSNEKVAKKRSEIQQLIFELAKEQDDSSSGS